MRTNEAYLGDDDCPWGLALTVGEQPFIGGPIQCDAVVKRRRVPLARLVQPRPHQQAGSAHFSSPSFPSHERTLIKSQTMNIQTTSTTLTLAVFLLTVTTTPRAAQAQPFDMETKLTGSDSGPNDEFGISAAISGGTAIVGARTTTSRHRLGLRVRRRPR